MKKETSRSPYERGGGRKAANLQQQKCPCLCICRQKCPRCLWKLCGSEIKGLYLGTLYLQKYKKKKMHAFVSLLTYIHSINQETYTIRREREMGCSKTWFWEMGYDSNCLGNCLKSGVSLQPILCSKHLSFFLSFEVWEMSLSLSLNLGVRIHCCGFYRYEVKCDAGNFQNHSKDYKVSSINFGK